MPSWLRPTDICVVTGGCNGLGAAIIQTLGAAGCPTVALDIALPNDEKQANTTQGKTVVENDATIKSDGFAQKNRTESTKEQGTQPRVEQYSENDESHQVQGNSANSITTEPPTSTSITGKVVSGSTSRTENSTRQPEEKPIEQFKESNTEDDVLKPSLVIKCDVRRQEDLANARQQIFEKFQRYPSVIVCNAGVRHPLNSIASTEFEDIEETIEVNLGGPLKCMRTFLPDILDAKRGFVVTIGSALGLVCPKGLSVYGASKAGVLGFHEALEQDISSFKDVHALLVCPGQIDTSMFADVKTPSERFAPIVEPEKLAKKIVSRIKKAKTSTVYSPPYVRYLSLVRAAPTPIASLVRKWSGVDKVYDDIVAQRQKAAADALAASLGAAESEPGLEKPESLVDTSATDSVEPREKNGSEDKDDRKLCVPKIRASDKNSAANGHSKATNASTNPRTRWLKGGVFNFDSHHSHHHYYPEHTNDLQYNIDAQPAPSDLFTDGCNEGISDHSADTAADYGADD